VRLDQLTSVDEGIVYTDQRRAGVLRRTLADVEFRYDPDFAGPAVATTLPVRPEPFSTGRAPFLPSSRACCRRAGG
jgi:hypothetical protein